MKIVDFTQREDDWHKWRNNGIGASEAGVLIGADPYRTPLQLWEEKCGYGPEKVITPPMAHGITHEDIARGWINSQNKLNLQPLCVEDHDISYFRASLDGWDETEKTLVEIKCPVSTDVLDRAWTTQSVPEHWYAQIQWQMMIVKPVRAFLAIWDFRTETCCQVEVFSLPSLQKELREAGVSFWHHVVTGKQPEPTDRDYLQIEDESIKAELEVYEEYHRRELEIKAEKKAIKMRLAEKVGERNFRAYGYTFSKMNPRRKYDMEQMRMDGIDIDKYLKETNPNTGWKITMPKKR